MKIGIISLRNGDYISSKIPIQIHKYDNIV